MKTKRLLVATGLFIVVLVATLWRCRNTTSSTDEETAVSTERLRTSLHARSRVVAPVARSVGGRVTRKDTGNGIAGAIVALGRTEPAYYGLSEAPPLFAKTDRQGRWSIPNVPAGTYSFGATARGFQPAFVVIEAREDRPIDLALAPGGATIVGTVSDLGGGPIAEAMITASGRKAVFATFTDEHGHYEISVEPGDTALRVTHEDYATAYVSSPAAADREVVTNIVLEPAGTILGRVVTRDGEPVADAIVEVRDRDLGNWWRQWAISDDGGNFTLRGLKSGVTDIAARKRGLASQTPTMIPLKLGQTIEDARVIVEPAFTISGRVVDDAKQPVANAIVRAVGDGDRIFLPPGATTEDGTFEIVGVPPAIYDIVATSELLRPRENARFELHADLEVEIVVERGVRLTGRLDPPARGVVGLSPPGSVVETTPDGHFVFEHRRDEKSVIDVVTEDGQYAWFDVPVGATDVVVPLNKGASIKGKVVDERGEPIAGAEISVETPKRYVQASTGRDGMFRVTAVEGTLAKLWVSYDDASTRAELAITPGVEATTTLTLTVPRSKITGVAVDASGAPLRDAKVSAYYERAPDETMSWARRVAYTSSTGELVIDRLVKGRYTLRLETAEGNADAELEHVDTGTSVRLVAKPRGGISGVVTLNGAPVPRFTIDCSGTTSIYRPFADPKGAYTLEFLRPGKYKCTVDANAGTVVSELEITGRTTVDFAIKPWAAMTGRVVDMLTGEPLSNVFVFQEGGRDWDKIRRGSVIRSDERGRFRTEQVTGKIQSLRVMNATMQDSTEVESPMVHVVEPGDEIDLGTLAIPGSIGHPRGKLGCEVDVDFKVTAVAPNGPAATAGIRIGDVIRSINGKQFDSWRWERAFIAGRSYQVELGRGVSIPVVAEPW